MNLSRHAACRIVCALLVALSFGVGDRAVADGNGPDDRVENQIVVELVPGVAIDDIAARYGVTPVESIPQWLIWRVETPPNAVDDIVDQMKRDPDIERAEPHRVLETPEGVKRSMSDLDLGLTHEAFRNQIAIETAHVAQTHDRYTGEGVIVAVLDTGTDVGHPEIAERILDLGADFAGGNGTGVAQDNGLDDDGDGLIDESSNHGTFVAGIINLIAPDARLLPVRVLEADGKGTSFAVAKGILYAMSRGADVINLSLAMGYDSRVVERAIEDAEDVGIVVVAATGNRGIEAVDFPAILPQTIAVAAVDAGKIRAEFSSYGPEVDVSAQGSEIVSIIQSEYFAHWDGTSFATPFVSGAVAVLLEKYPGLTGDEVRDLLQQTAQPDNNGPELDGLMGAGVVDVDELSRALASDRTSLEVEETPFGTVTRWSPVLNATRYDVIRGDVAQLQLVTNGAEDVVDLGLLRCIVDDVDETDTVPFPDPDIPAAGQVFFYLFRADATDEPPSAYGTDSEGNLRISGGSDCSIVAPNP